ncbi:hypothetical protein [Streptomyces glomeratus]|uniref:DUF3040 domain-containing protein n=1 Tax=Streptomyces glomeratus TaxID=284452 RepID=A0ABP6LES1_9ACTN|nr:hypothetical protein [Streptomyces glomeratus]MCF1507039.1 hypothetical protein [Streptomyces glomeratus]
MSAIEKAAREAVEAADNTELTRQIVAILAAQQLLNQQQPQQPAAPAQRFDAKKWVVIGGVVVSVGLVGALFAVAIAVGAVCATACLLILRSMWRDFQKGN